MLMNKAVEVKTREELAIMRQAGGVVGDILVLLKGMVKPGMTTGEIDQISRQELKKRNAKPAFLNYHGFPGVICVSINSDAATLVVPKAPVIAVPLPSAAGVGPNDHSA